MTIFRKRFKSRAELITLFAICAFPIHVWAIYRIIQEVPQWLLRLTLPQVISVAAYTLMFTLLETIVVFLAVLLLFLILPARWFDRGRLLPYAAISLTLTTILIVWMSRSRQSPISNNQLPGTLIVLALVLGLLILAYVWLQRSPSAARRVNAFIERLVPLALLYILIDILSVGVVLFRNLFA